MSTTQKKISRTICFTVFLALLVFAAMFCLIKVFADDGADCEITEVTLDKSLDGISLRARLSESYINDNKISSVYVFELSPGTSSDDINKLEPVAKIDAATEISCDIPFDSSSSDAIFARYILATKYGYGVYAKYTVVSNERYISGIENMASDKSEYPKFASKKGLRVSYISDAQELGVAHTVITVPANEYMLGEKTDDSFAYGFDGKTYYVSYPMLEVLDYKIKTMSSAGINVYIELVLSSPDKSADQSLSCLYFDGVQKSDSSYYLLNTDSPDAIKYFSSFARFLAMRYTRSDRLYGFAGSIIAGYEVDRSAISCVSNAKNLDEFAQKYAKMFRIIHTSLKSVYAEGRVYIPLSNRWNASDGDDARNYGARSVLDAFNREIASGGNIDYRICINPYPSSYSNTSFWRDDEAFGDVDTEYMTMINLEILCDYVRKDELLYNSSPRSILIGDFGINGKFGDTSEERQAAAYAYAYYKIYFNDGIEAMIYHSQIDYNEETDLYLGLCTAPTAAHDAGIQRKRIYGVFKSIDAIYSGNETETVVDTDFALPILGVSSWSDLIDGFDANRVIDRKVYTEIPTSANVSSLRKNTVFDFSEQNLYDFVPAEYAEYVEAVSGDILFAKFLNVSAVEYMGISSKLDEVKLGDADYISIKLKITAPDAVPSVDFMLRLTGRDEAGNELVYTANAQLVPGKETEVTFPLSRVKDFANDFETAKLWIRSSDGKYYSGDYAMSIDSISLYTGKIATSSVARIVAVIVSVCIVAICAAVTTVVIIKKKKAK